MTNSNARAGGLVTGAVLIGLGVLFLLAQLFEFASWRYLWPVTLVAVGGLFFAGMFAGGRSAAGLAIPGSILAMLGLINLVQNAFGYWSSWAYSWTLIIVSIGLGIYVMGWRQADAAHQQRGLRLAGTGVVLFVIFGSLFELGGLFFGARGAAQIVFPVLLIGAGLYLIVRRLGWWPAAAAPLPPAPPAAEPPAVPPVNDQPNP